MYFTIITFKSILFTYLINYKYIFYILHNIIHIKNLLFIIKFLYSLILKQIIQIFNHNQIIVNI